MWVFQETTTSGRFSQQTIKQTSDYELYATHSAFSYLQMFSIYIVCTLITQTLSLHSMTSLLFSHKIDCVMAADLWPFVWHLIWLHISVSAHPAAYNSQRVLAGQETNSLFSYTTATVWLTHHVAN